MKLEDLFISKHPIDILCAINDKIRERPEHCLYREMMKTDCDILAVGPSHKSECYKCMEKLLSYDLHSV